MLELPPLVQVIESTPVTKAIDAMVESRSSCAVVVDAAGKLKGIFTDRDCLLKMVKLGKPFDSVRIGEVMTADPVRETLECQVAYALNLMSVGGFRHLPLVDAQDTPVAVLAVKDVLDAIVKRFLNDMSL
jgi:CBS domain-containing protein